MRCGNQHTAHLSPEMLERITLKNEQRTGNGIENEMDKHPCTSNENCKNNP